jgi:hypothetical protein
LDGKLVEFPDPGEESKNTEFTLIDTTVSHTSSEEKEIMIDSVHRYNKKIESLNFEYNNMLSQTVSSCALTIHSDSLRTRGRTLRGVSRICSGRRERSCK